MYMYGISDACRVLYEIFQLFDGNLVRTRISLIFLSRLYAIRGRDWKMSAVSSSSVRRLKLLYNMCLTCWLSGWKVRVIGMRSLVFCLSAGSKASSCVRGETFSMAEVVTVVG